VAVVPATQEVIHRESDHGLRLALEKNIRPYLKKVNLSKKKKKDRKKGWRCGSSGRMPAWHS
jgi:hypothetical protein